MSGQTTPLGALIRRLRTQRGWSQQDLANQVNRVAGDPGAAMTREYVSNVERGKRAPEQRLPDFAAAFGVPVETLRRARARTAKDAPSTASGDFPAELQAGLLAEGITATAAARALGYSPAYISRVLNGKQRPSLAFAQALDDLLGAGGRLAALVPERAPRMPVPALALDGLAPDVELFDRISRATADPRRVDAHAIEWLERCLAEHRRVEDEIGSGPVIGVVRAQLDAVMSLVRDARPVVRGRLVGLAAEYGQFTAWLHNDSGDKQGAIGWYDRSHAWAVEAGDPDMAATTLSMKAHIAWSLGDGQRTVQLGDAARWYGDRVSPAVTGMAAQMAARGHALLGDADEARRQLDEAERLLRMAAENPDWLYFYDGVWFRAQRGMIELDLGNSERAVELLGSALDEMPAHYRRDRAWYGSCLAKAHALAGDLDAAVGVALEAAPDARSLNRYAEDELRGVVRTVRRRSPRLAADVADALRT
ncbi:helix-turn-helix transcriptional regulator [Marinitenerispora sediminis]|uniref:DNA-binding protein n=1 Tax=Marinitenerispora sediminis TaxID=1931232 RepID=A0A368T6B9_9ACTN|nr:helix-turn-helix transcriptional regulator [Marinitenerispora sediminis]RCV53451.1 DNA-binding protein [Marinitenerispora sediminis]RCV59279.1 DNA-binding protein [Marinitenerispora sediminis]